MPPPLYLGEAPTEAAPSTEFAFHDLNSTYPSPPRSGYNSPVPPPPPLGSGGSSFFGSGPPPYGSELSSPYDEHHQHQPHQQQDPHLPHFHSPQFVPECLPPLSALTKTEDDEDDFVCATDASPSGLYRYKVRRGRTREGKDLRSMRVEWVYNEMPPLV